MGFLNAERGSPVGDAWQAALTLRNSRQYSIDLPQKMVAYVLRIRKIGRAGRAFSGCSSPHSQCNGRAKSKLMGNQR